MGQCCPLRANLYPRFTVHKSAVKADVLLHNLFADVELRVTEYCVAKQLASAVRPPHWLIFVALQVIDTEFLEYLVNPLSYLNHLFYNNRWKIAVRNS